MAAEYSKLTKTQKLAAFLITIGPENAGRMMKDFENSQVELICREIAEMQVLDANVRKEALKEFAGVVANGVRCSLGGVPFAQLMLGEAKDEVEASAILSRCASERNGGVGSEIRRMDGRQVLNIAKNEQPQTIALIVSCMDPKKAAELLAKLTPEVREEVIERLGSMETTSHDAVAKVVKNMNRQTDHQTPAQSVQPAGGVKACVNILNALNKDIRKELITRIEERDASLGAAIRKQSFCFEDLGRLSPSDLQRVLREVDSASLPVALKGVNPEVVSAILAAMSKRAAQSVRDEIDQLGPQKLKDVEAAQERVIKIVRKLEETEEITLDAGGDDNALV